MESKTFIGQLNEYAQHTQSELKYEDVAADGPDHIRRFTMRAVVNGTKYDVGTGLSKKEAKQHAAKNALEGLGKESMNTSLPSSCPPSPLGQSITQANFTCWLNEYGQKNRITIKCVESTRAGPIITAECHYVVGEKPYPVAIGNTKREAKEEAAKLVFQEINNSQTIGNVDENCSAAGTSQTQDLNQNVLALCNKVEHLNMDSTTEPQNTNTNFIGILNHYCQKEKLCHDYKLVERRGLPHDPQFVYKVVMDKKEYPEGVGNTAKSAKQDAAQHAWSALQEQSDWNSQVSLRSNVSEDGEPAQETSTTWGSHDTTPQSMATSDTNSIVFAESPKTSLSKNQSPQDVKPKRKLAANFLVPFCSSIEKGKEGNVLHTSNKTSNQPINSRFLSDFDSIERMGKGGFGHVYKARHKLEGRYYAVKIVRSKAKSLREVEALASLQHCNIVRYCTTWMEDTEYKCDTTSDSYSTSHSGSDSSAKFLYIQMELCDKKTLKVWIDERNSHRDPKRREESQHTIQQILHGVVYIHSKKLIHRDLKPANIMFASDKKVKIGDFGLATAEDNDNDESLIERTKRTGTKSYMAPEQLNSSKYDRKVDIFASGLIFLELLWNFGTVMEKQKEWQDVRSQKFPQEFSVQFASEQRLIETMLHESPEDRPEAQHLEAELKDLEVRIPDQNHRDNKTC